MMLDDSKIEQMDRRDKRTCWTDKLLTTELDGAVQFRLDARSTICTSASTGTRQDLLYLGSWVSWRHTLGENFTHCVRAMEKHLGVASAQGRQSS